MTATGSGRDLTTQLVVAGAHLRGEPLHPSLLALGARFVRATRTAPEYRMVALPALDGAGGGPPSRRGPAWSGIRARARRWRWRSTSFRSPPSAA